MRRSSVLGGWVATLAIVLFVSGSGDRVRAEPPELQLTLAEVLQTALENNLDLEFARIDPQVSEQSVDIQRDAFDPTLSSSFNFSDRTSQAQASALQANSTETESSSTSITQDLGWGGSYEARFDLRRQDQPGFQFNVANPSFNASLTVLYSQQLLSGRGRESSQEGLLNSRRDLDNAFDTLEATTLTTMETVESAYWDLAAARRALEVEQNALLRSNRFLELNRRKVEVGTLAPIEVTQAEADVAAQEEQVIIAENTLENAEDELRRLLGVPLSDPMWLRRLVPQVREEMFGTVEVDLQDSIDTALRERPELRRARRTLENRELSVRAAKNRVLPQLTADVGFIPSGDNINFVPVTDGAGNPIPNAFVQEKLDLNDAIAEIGDVVNYTYQAGITLRYPLFNRANQARFKTAQLQRDQADIDITNQERNVEVEVRQAVRNVVSGEKRVEAARANVRLQREKLEAEQKKFENGMSTSFEVLTFQNDLANAELSEIRALLDYAKSLTTLERSKGTLLDARGLVLASD